MKHIYIIIFIFSSFFSFSQVGIGTTNPTTTLDIDGDLRVRSIPASTSTNDTPIVIDSDGYVKKSLRSSQGNFRGRLSVNYNSADNTTNTSGIYHINPILEIIDSGNDYSTNTDRFYAPITGTYEVTITLTIKGYATTIPSNYVVGLISSAGNWKMRFSMEDEEFINSGSSIGVARTYTGIVTLYSGYYYRFGFAGDLFLLLSNPSGSTGKGIGSYFKIELLDNN